MADISSHRFDLHGRVAVVTGGAGLLGRGYVETLCRAGAAVVVADIDGPRAEDLAGEMAGCAEGRVLAVQTDVASPDSVRAMVKRTLDELGRLDILVNNAAIDPKVDRAHASAHTDRFEDYPFDLWQRSLDVNVTGAYLCAQAAVVPMLQAGRGAIVNVSSIYGLVGPDQRLYERDDDAPRTIKPVTYSVGKSAMLGLTRYLAAYLGPQSIRVNTLTLGGVFNDHDEGFVERYSRRTPLGRMAHKHEYNDALLFLVSDASSYMTGANLVVDGGWTAW